MTMNRRQALGQILKITGAAAGGAALGSTHVFAAEEPWRFSTADLKNGLTYATLDPMRVAQLAWEGKSFGCMYQVFHALVAALAESDSPDAEKFAAIPTALSAYGGGGVMGLGTVCGNNNAAGMLYKILNLGYDGETAIKPKSLGQVSAYYQHTPMPYNDAAFLEGLGIAQADYDTKVVTQTTSNSLLCHASVTRWADAADKDTADKGFRCQLMSASMAYRIAEILNAELAGTTLEGAPVYSDNTNTCKSCHTPKDSMGTSVFTGMECDACHGEL